MKEINKSISDIIEYIEDKYPNGEWVEIEIETPNENNIDDEPFDSIIQPYLDKLIKEFDK